MPVSLIIADVDGCLTSEDSVPWDLPGMAQLARISRAATARAHNDPLITHNEGDEALPLCAPLTLCTGRPQPYAEALAKLLDIRAPLICESGAVIYTLADNRARFGPGVTPEKIAGLRAVRRFLETDYLPHQPEAFLQFGKEAQLSVFSRRTELFEPLREKIAAFIARENGPALDVSASHFYLNVSLAGVDKGAAIREVLNEVGLKKEATAGIGDTIGDKPLAENVGFFACPADSVDGIKQVANYVATKPMLDGVLEILARPECAYAH